MVVPAPDLATLPFVPVQFRPLVRAASAALRQEQTRSRSRKEPGSLRSTGSRKRSPPTSRCSRATGSTRPAAATSSSPVRCCRRSPRRPRIPSGHAVRIRPMSDKAGVDLGEPLAPDEQPLTHSASGEVAEERDLSTSHRTSAPRGAGPRGGWWSRRLRWTSRTGSASSSASRPWASRSSDFVATGSPASAATTIARPTRAPSRRWPWSSARRASASCSPSRRAPTGASTSPRAARRTASTATSRVR